MRILVIEDEDRVASLIKKGLEEMGFSVTIAAEGLIGKKLALSELFDLIITDILLPDTNGIEICKYIRQELPDIPIIMLTALGTTDDKVEGFDAGANDYLVKPFALEELLARVKALLRRRNPPDIVREILHFADLELDTATRQATRGNRLIDLSTTEYELLAMFLRNPRIVLTRTVLMDRIWGTDFEGGPNVLEVYIGHLRSKLEQHGEKRLIQTVRGAGYVLRTGE